MSTDKKEEQFKPYKPEEPVDAATREHEQDEIRKASKHAAQEMASEEPDQDDAPMSREQAEKELYEAARKVQQEKKKSH